MSAEEQATAAKIERVMAKDKALAGTSVALKAGSKARGARLVVTVDLKAAARMAKAVAKAVR